ncbi:N-acetyl-gamma-glutamyl-phosphate reductase [Gracilinema caldarium]|uniref:N-acetyl-gamma-glutamyl-phosphate reductase n=1 Tax=Gracilinema caldarium TaxID=215591 RepID=UPI0026EA580B|nr:N-acetyl-gamma-glutamyl-phosphate reductase [Gracilinema caldarium]
MKYRVFVDGNAGTTGLQIGERLSRRNDVELLTIRDELRKDVDERRRLINEADVVFLCLPDDAARESVSLVSNPRTIVIDASTAHRTLPEWTYGLPELSEAQRDRISRSKRIAVPGCHATGFVLLVRPLVDAGFISPDYPLACHSVTGYSGGGHKLIDAYRSGQGAGTGMEAARHYALSLQHKHLPEMRLHGGLSRTPLFTPIIGNFERGMAVAIPLHVDTLAKKTDLAGIQSIYTARYGLSRFVKVMPLGEASLPEAGYFDPTACNGTNRAEIFVYGNESQALLICRLDNLGKGASGAALQCMNIALGLDEGLGL